MQQVEIKGHLLEAENLYKHGQYLDALQHLAKVNSAFPETFDNLWLMLLCREKLGRFDEAYELCTHMMDQFPEESDQEQLRPVYNRLCNALNTV